MAKRKTKENVDDLNTINVPLTPLRMELAKLTKEGVSLYPLGDLILLIRDIVRKDK